MVSVRQEETDAVAQQTRLKMKIGDSETREIMYMYDKRGKSRRFITKLDVLPVLIAEGASQDNAHVTNENISRKPRHSTTT